MSADHYTDTERLVRLAASASDTASAVSYASEATVYALLAVADRLAALVVEQHTATLVAAYNGGALEGGEEYGRVRALINGLLGPVEPKGPQA
ncbi:hypothetical protein [Nocardia brasiliensis]|uniref:hypothetical protein n=1 Tax=Nocardia brasiliensis TaxID=37326 RepID=UPI0024586145|nr:hypothetical protein [Nocardia brasiliensis]